ncbi:prolyl-tRNA synthetase associated domain-containing protein [Pseudemcibacter aquimaris]|uniref:prolyl-tRNA synthetase associated domain-containing protein n=1 Tax=Pseudemcibacter aquimaris TaxID=2857064 RepID=UPI0020116516|nr:prolyl-tRNA synthetase associated domain-containing protein [Pseudemcibacter aquimaris]MCC3861678.1 prolyl-tRNA synthetase associated domain-containing protein [Pseudemcibacter aquimaris]WDU58449.1 prolyl-tRNA synthetase associated domain-containing protein [Pseudemcibacter aquimaris]
MPATEQDLYALFDELGIETKLFRHAPLFTVEESQNLRGEIEGGHCKNLFLKDKKNNFILAVLSEERKVDLKALFKSDHLNVGRLSFASADRMVDMLGIEPGSVTPFSLINVTHKDLIVILDKGMMEHEYLNYHPLHNEATTTIHRDDLLKFIGHFGFDPIIIDFDTL